MIPLCALVLVPKMLTLNFHSTCHHLLRFFWFSNFSMLFIQCNCLAAAAAAKSLQSCPTRWGHRDGSPPGSHILGILQARTLEWVAISFSNAWKWKVKGKSLSRVQLLATPWTTAYQAPPSMGFSRQEYWSGVPLPSLVIVLGDNIFLPNFPDCALGFRIYKRI